MIGIKDPQVWSAYLLCILSSIFCVIYGWINWDKGEEPVHAEDKKWVDDQKKVSEGL